MIINLEENAWRQILAILARAPWNEANGLIMAIGEQMRQQLQPMVHDQPPPAHPIPPTPGADVTPPHVKRRGNSSDQPPD